MKYVIIRNTDGAFLTTVFKRDNKANWSTDLGEAIVYLSEKMASDAIIAICGPEDGCVSWYSIEQVLDKWKVVIPKIETEFITRKQALEAMRTLMDQLYIRSMIER